MKKRKLVLATTGGEQKKAKWCSWQSLILPFSRTRQKAKIGFGLNEKKDQNGAVGRPLVLPISRTCQVFSSKFEKNN